MKQHVKTAIKFPINRDFPLTDFQLSEFYGTTTRQALKLAWWGGAPQTQNVLATTTSDLPLPSFTSFPRVWGWRWAGVG